MKTPRLIRGAFTIIEMLVVVSIIVLLIIVAVPAFQGMLKSSDETLAEGQLTNALRAARDTALRSGSGNDAAAVFFFNETGRLSIVTYVKTARFRDVGFDSAANQIEVEREVFVAAPNAQAAQLPRGWVVRGFAATGMIEESLKYGWYSSQVGQSGRYSENEGNWVLPETSVFNERFGKSGPSRNTFMVRFEGGTGRVVASASDGVLVLALGADADGVGEMARSAQVNEPAFTTLRRLALSDPAKYVQSVLKSQSPGWPDYNGAANPEPLLKARRAVVGRESTDMVLARPVTQLSLMDENQVARSIGVRLDSSFPVLIKKTDPDTIARGATFVQPGDVNAGRINRWIEGDTDNDMTYGGPDDVFEAKMFVFERYTGKPRRVDIQREPGREPG